MIILWNLYPYPFCCVPVEQFSYCWELSASGSAVCPDPVSVLGPVDDGCPYWFWEGCAVLLSGEGADTCWEEGEGA